MATNKLLLLPGDGIGPEIMAEVKKIISWFNARGGDSFETDEGLVGGSAYDAHGQGYLRRRHGQSHGFRCCYFRCGRRSEVGRRPL